MMERLEKLEEEFGAEAREAAEAFSGDLYVLTFQENRRGGDPVAHTPDGKAVFPDKFRRGEEILVGDTWLCDVTSKGGSTFFAAPLKRIDTAFFFDLATEQVERIVQVALSDHREALMPILDAAVERQADAATKRRLSELQADKETVEAQLKDLGEQYDDAEGRLRRYELEVRALREQLAAAGNGSVQTAEPERQRANGHAAQPWSPVPGASPFDNGTARADRVAEDVLFSQAFVHDRYYGHISPDRKRLFVKPHQNGNLPCVNGRLHIPGLDKVVPYGGQAEHQAHFDPRHGGWFVRL